MPMQLDAELAVLSGKCSPEEAFDFFEWLKAGGKHIRLEEVTHLHSAFVQCLMAFRPEVDATGADPFIADLVQRAIVAPS